MLEHAYYTVISPEGCASILWRDAARYPEAAEALKITADDLVELGVIDGAIKEPIGGAHTCYSEMSQNMKDAILNSLDEFEGMSADELRNQRYDKFRAMGQFIGL